MQRQLWYVVTIVVIVILSPQLRTWAFLFVPGKNGECLYFLESLLVFEVDVECTEALDGCMAGRADVCRVIGAGQRIHATLGLGFVLPHDF